MRIEIVTPASAGARSGNRVTANRWARLFRSLGHEVRILSAYRDSPCDLLVALHAKKSAAAVARSRRIAPKRPIVLTLTGTDLYRDLAHSAIARRALETADRLVVLHPGGRDALPFELRARARVIQQSQPPVGARPRVASRRFEVCVIGHLRPVKDPFRTALAARRVPNDSKLHVVHVGAALSDAMARRARAEEARNPRYRWLGELPRGRALGVLARSRLLVLSSKMEGGANVIGEAIARRVPILASRIDGSIGLLGADYPGWFEVGDTGALAALLLRAEREPAFLRALTAAGRRRAAQFSPAREKTAWRALLRELRP